MGDYTHSKQVRFDKAHSSCGIVEMHHLPDQPPEQTMFALGTQLYHKANGRPAAFVLFSDIVGGAAASRGENLAATLKASGVVGPVYETPVAVNPRTGNRIRVWLISLDHDKFRRWYSEEYVNRVAE